MTPYQAQQMEQMLERRNQTPESNQVQRASKSGLTQDNTEKRDDGVSANSGGRRQRQSFK